MRKQVQTPVEQQQISPPIQTETEEARVRPLQVPTIQEQSRAIAEQVATQRELRLQEAAEQHRRSERWRQTVLTAFFGEGPNQKYADFFRDVAALMASGRTIEESLHLISETNTTPELRRIAADVATQVAAGVPLSRALAGWQQYLPEIVVPIVEVNERTGSLQTAMRQLAEAFQKSVAIDRKFEYNPLLNPVMGYVLAVCSTMVFAPFWIESAPLFAAYCAGCITTSGVLWKKRHQLARRQPRALKKAAKSLKPTRRGMTARYMGTARWQRSFATLWQCGVPISQALEVAAESGRNAHYRYALQQAAERTRAGWTLHDSLAETRLLPVPLLNAIKTGEMTGDLGPAMDELARFLEDDSKMLAAQSFGMGLVGALFLIAGLGVAKLSPVAGLLIALIGFLITKVLFRMTANEVAEMREKRRPLFRLGREGKREES